MALNVPALAAAFEDAFRNTEPGEDSVSALCWAMANAVDAFVKSGQVIGNTAGGSCAYQGSHIPLPVIGQVI